MKTVHRRASQFKRQYQADPQTLWKTVGRTTGFSEADQIKCSLPVMAAWERLKTGAASAEDVCTLADASGICVLAAQGMDALVLETAEAAANTLKTVADRYVKHRVWGVDHATLRDVPPMIDLYEELFRNATGGQMEDWLQVTRSCKVNAFAGGV